MVGPKKIYIDTNVFITLYLKREFHKNFAKFLRGSEGLEVELLTSEWTLTEIVKVLKRECGFGSQRIANFILKLRRERRIAGIKFSFIGVSPDKSYDFNEFFYHLQEIMLKYKITVSDAIHNLVMKNHNIKHILTADSDFDGIKGVMIIDPSKYPI